MGSLGNKQIMARNIQYYMSLHHKDRNDMCEALGVKYTTFTDWVKGNSYPRIDKIELMANYFGISKSDLVEEHSSQSNSTKGHTINVLGRVAAGIPINAITEISIVIRLLKFLGIPLAKLIAPTNTSIGTAAAMPIKAALT